MAMMKQEIVEFYDTKEEALAAGEMLKKWFGHDYEIEPESDNIFCRRWKLVATINKSMTG